MHACVGESIYSPAWDEPAVVYTEGGQSILGYNVWGGGEIYPRIRCPGDKVS